MKRDFSTITSQRGTSHCLVLSAPCPSQTVLTAFLHSVVADLKRGSADKDFEGDL